MTRRRSHRARCARALVATLALSAACVRAPAPAAEPAPEQPVEELILDALRNGRGTVREVGFDVPSAVIRETLDALVARGLVVKDGPRYRLAPKTPQSPPASVLLEAIPTT